MSALCSILPPMSALCFCPVCLSHFVEIEDDIVFYGFVAVRCGIENKMGYFTGCHGDGGGGGLIGRIRRFFRRVHEFCFRLSGLNVHAYVETRWNALPWKNKYIDQRINK